MNIPPLCIIQARLHSTRLPGKMLLTLGRETLIARAVRLAGEAFGEAHVVVAIPATDEPGPLGDELRELGANIYAHDGPEWDVLDRFHGCATRSRWHPDAVIHRWTPDDWDKSPTRCREVADGVRHPVELGGEAFTLRQLTRAHQLTGADEQDLREHIGRHPMLFPFPPIPAPSGVTWTIDTPWDYAQVVESGAAA